MSARWLILADDLTGAADCAIAFAKTGCETVVSWGAGDNSFAVDVTSVDVDSRRFPAAAAAARHVAAQATRWCAGARLYKKIDSTLRGQPAAELAAQLAAIAAKSGKRAPLAVVAPAFPGAGRLTIGGKVMVNGAPLESTPVWARDHTYETGALPAVLATSGLTCEVIGLDVVKAGASAVLARLRAADEAGLAAVVCDADCDADLRIVADASLELADAVWVGTGGLAVALAAAEQPAQPIHPRLPAPDGAVLMVVGSLAESSRLQAKKLVDSHLVAHVPVMPQTLFAGPGTPAWDESVHALAERVMRGGPILLEIALVERPDLARGAELVTRLADMIVTVAPKIGALVATGGDTACAVLSRLGVTGIRLIDEVEPGVPLGLTIGARAIPVVTKAGAFGDADTLRRCLARLENCPPSA